MAKIAGINPPKFLTVVLRNDGPLIFCGDSPSYRSVRIELTEAQRQALELRYVGTNCGMPIHESISRCFIED